MNVAAVGFLTPAVALNATSDDDDEQIDSACFNRLTGRTPREGQCLAVWQIVDSVDKKQNFILQALTGVGKTLIAIASIFQLLAKGLTEKVVLAPHTKLLQKQYEQELRRCADMHPELLGRADVAVLYGKSNYICRVKLSEASEKASSESMVKLIQRINEYSSAHNGQMPTFDDLSPPPKRDDDWKRIACGGDHKCPLCEHTVALERAREAKIVVVNQTLLWCFSQFAHCPRPQLENDWRDYLHLEKKNGTVIFIDEAHELESLATDRTTWTVTLDSALKKLEGFVSKAFSGENVKAGRLWEKGPQKELEECCHPLIHYIKKRGANENLFDKCHLDWPEVVKGMVRSYANALNGAVDALLDEYGPYKAVAMKYMREQLKKRSKGDDEDCALMELRQQHVEHDDHLPDATVEQRLRDHFHLNRLQKVLSTMDMSISEYSEVKDASGVPVADAISLSVEDGDILLRGQPLTASTFIQESIWCNPVWKCRACVCMSATITIEGSFKSFRDRHGLSGPVPVRCLSLPGVFDYARQMKIHVSSYRGKSPDTASELVQFVEGCSKACLLLFTNLDRMSKVSEELERRFRGSQRVVHKAGEDVDAAMKLMRETPHAVVLGCKRYWTGVDVDTLGLVCVDAMPWASNFWPSKNLMIKCGLGTIFQKYYNDRMIQLAIQGIGRLIRTPSSEGKIFIADSRANKYVKAIESAFPGAAIQPVAKRPAAAPFRDNPKRTKMILHKYK